MYVLPPIGRLSTMARSGHLMKTFLYYFFGPQLHHIYRSGSIPFRFCTAFFKWTSPVWLGYMYHRGT
ncbi:hypothetical protein LSH36_342g03000 [Paralvinella palmiformis]|uniref:Uncharacterized protein n=1 Tax=Paralvinella palmiformis TaxID=53620 RepID=A0AAD9JFG6_9ANNE|nr:hypothetical protein LSH36_342g03000 [Paralvinella palmiformis]